MEIVIIRIVALCLGRITNGGIIALKDGNGDSHADMIETFGSGGRTAIGFHDDWLYYSTPSLVYRYKYTAGKLVPAGEPQVIIDGLPVEGL
ncbi:MAG: hypothetical protein M3O30_13995 [Planctomycetota bacterium]|nr:hypothetical protein [Planctomycetota bacterium]